MADSVYRPGAWFAVVGVNAALLVSDELSQSGLDALWCAVGDMTQIDELLALLAAQSPQPPAYGVVVTDGVHVSVHLRIGATAIVTDATGRSRAIDSGAINTRVEYAVSDVDQVTLGRAGAADGGPLLPLGTGIVAADSLDWHPAISIAGSGPGITASAVDDEDSALIDKLPPMPPPPLPLSLVQPPAPVADGARDESHLDDTHDLQSGDHDGRTVARSAVQVPRQTDRGGDQVQAVLCSQEHANPAHAQQCRLCGEPLAPQEPVLVARPSLGRLRFSTGQVVELDRRVVVGRAPSVERVSGDDLPQLVQVDSPEQDISRSHAEVRLEGWHVLLVDLDTINGTTVTVPGGQPERLHALEPHPLLPGALVDLAGEVTFHYEGAS